MRKRIKRDLIGRVSDGKWEWSTQEMKEYIQEYINADKILKEKTYSFIHNPNHIKIVRLGILGVAPYQEFEVADIRPKTSKDPKRDVINNVTDIYMYVYGNIDAGGLGLISPKEACSVEYELNDKKQIIIFIDVKKDY